jgi:light-regulated signal transduction histidine kinase (bacteriophytochrome)
VSHDLRAPLRHIAGYGDLLREQEGERMSDKSRRFLNNMLDSARFAGTLVDDLLTFSQMGRAALRPAPVDLDQLVRSVVQEFEVEGSGRRIEWAIGELPRVTGDAAFLQLALRNLISNAVKYTRTRESAKIEIFATRGGDEHVIGVRDNGVGFDMKYGAKLFGVFQRLHRAEEFEGTGIGLANVRRIVERHDGRTWAEGRLGEGAVFYFSLPAEFRNANGAQGAATTKPRKNHA